MRPSIGRKVFQNSGGEFAAKMHLVATAVGCNWGGGRGGGEGWEDEEATQDVG